MTFHVTIAREGRWKLFETEPAQRAAVRAVCRSYGARLLLYCVVDDHIHAVVRGDRADVGRATAGLQHVLRRRIAPREGSGPFTEPARIRPVESRTHLEHLVGYVIGQPTRHGLAISAARWQGSCFQDLVGARTVGSFDSTAIGRHLPRLTPEHLWAAAGMPPLEPLAMDQIEAFGPRGIVQAAAAAHLAPSDLSGRARDAVEARALACGMLHLIGVPSERIASIVGCSVRTARRRRRPPEQHLRAALLQLAIARHVRLEATRRS